MHAAKSNEELVAQARKLLTKRCGVPVETIPAEIAGRIPTLSVPQSLPQGTMGVEDERRTDDFSDDEFLRRKRTTASKAGKGRS